MSDLPDALRYIVMTVPSLTAEQMASLDRAATLIDAIDALASAPVVDSHMVRQIERLIHREDGA